MNTGSLIRYFYIQSIPVVSSDYPAPDIQFTDVDENPVSSSIFQGKVVLYYIWDTFYVSDSFCLTCEDEMRILEDYYNEHKDAGFTVVAIPQSSGLYNDPYNDDKITLGHIKEKVRAAPEKFGISFPVLLFADLDAEYSLYTASETPWFYLVDRNGIVRSTWGKEISRELLEKYVTPLILEK